MHDDALAGDSEVFTKSPRPRLRVAHRVSGRADRTTTGGNSPHHRGGAQAAPRAQGENFGHLPRAPNDWIAHTPVQGQTYNSLPFSSFDVARISWPFATPLSVRGEWTIAGVRAAKVDSRCLIACFVRFDDDAQLQNSQGGVICRSRSRGKRRMTMPCSVQSLSALGIGRRRKALGTLRRARSRVSVYRLGLFGTSGGSYDFLAGYLFLDFDPL